VAPRILENLWTSGPIYIYGLSACTFCFSYRFCEWCRSNVSKLSATA